MIRSRNFPHGIQVETCAHLQCNRPRRTMQLCHSHYRRLMEGQSIATPLKVQRSLTEICSEPGCSGDAFLMNLCSPHWRKARLAEIAA